MSNLFKDIMTEITDMAGLTDANNSDAEVQAGSLENTEISETAEMNEQLEEVCKLFIDNREILHDLFRWEGDEMHLLGSSILTSADTKPDIDKLKECDKILKENSGVFSTFRGHVKMTIICTMYGMENPAEYFHKVDIAYKQMKFAKWGSDELNALAAVLLAERAVDEEDLNELIAETSTAYSMLRAEKAIKSEMNLVVIAAMLAMSKPAEIESLVEEFIKNFHMCSKLLEDAIPKQSLKSLCMVIALDSGSQNEYSGIEYKCEQIKAIYGVLNAKGIKFSRGGDISALAGLIMMGLDNEEIVSSIYSVDSFLKKQRGFGFLGVNSDTRHMYAAVLVMNSFGKQAITIENEETISKITVSKVVQSAVQQQIMATAMIMLTVNANLLVTNAANTVNS